MAMLAHPSNHERLTMDPIKIGIPKEQRPDTLSDFNDLIERCLRIVDGDGTTHQIRIRNDIRNQPVEVILTPLRVPSNV
jgi:hypothetical protein